MTSDDIKDTIDVLENTIANNPVEYAKYLAGNEAMFGFILGAMSRAAGYMLDASLVKKLIDIRENY